MVSAVVENIRFLINGRYIVTTPHVESIDGEKVQIRPKTILTVNRFDNDTPILRWRDFSLNKFVETRVTKEFIEQTNLVNFN